MNRPQIPAVPTGDQRQEHGDGDPFGGEMVAPDKAVRVGQMARQLLEEVRGTELDESGRERLRRVHARSVEELTAALGPDLTDELCTLLSPLDDDGPPSTSELMVAQAQLVGWLEGLFQGVQATMIGRQLAARRELEAMQQGRRGAPAVGPGNYL